MLEIGFVYFGFLGLLHQRMQMKSARLRFYEELNDYLPEDRRKRAFACCYEGEMTAAGLLAAAGVPLSVVDLILINDESVDPAHVLRDGDRMSCYPVFERFDIHGASRVRREPLRRPAFLADRGLERLVAYLRLLGFDARPASPRRAGASFSAAARPPRSGLSASTGCMPPNRETRLPKSSPSSSCGA
jgi:hypothetical protein